jgi:hypothetical protein
MESGVFQVECLRTEAQILRGMVRSVLHCQDDQLTVEQLVGTIMRIFLRGVQTRSD